MLSSLWVAFYSAVLMIILYCLNVQFLLEANPHFIFPLTLQQSHTVGFRIKLLANHSAALPHSQLFTISTNPSIQFYSMQFNSKRLNSIQFNSLYHTLVPILSFFLFFFLLFPFFFLSCFFIYLFFLFWWMIKAYTRNRSGNLINHSAVLSLEGGYFLLCATLDYFQFSIHILFNALMCFSFSLLIFIYYFQKCSFLWSTR